MFKSEKDSLEKERVDTYKTESKSEMCIPEKAVGNWMQSSNPGEGIIIKKIFPQTYQKCREVK